MKLSITFILLYEIFILSLCQADTIVVDINGAGDFVDIQAGLDAAHDGDVVVVEPGEYVISSPLDFNRLYDPGNPESPPLKNITVNAVEGPEVTSLKFMVSDETPVYPRSAVIFKSGETGFSEFTGFKISGSPTCAITCIASSPLLRYLIITNNWGGISCVHFGAPLVENCTITKNSGDGVNGEYGVKAVFHSCRITEQRYYGVLCRGDFSPTFYNCLISGNGFGGVYCMDMGDPRLVNCEISGNAGGGLCTRLNHAIYRIALFMGTRLLVFTGAVVNSVMG